MMTPERLKNIYAVLLRHCHSSVLPDINMVLEQLRKHQYRRCSVTVVPKLPDGGAYRKLIADLHEDMVHEPLLIVGVSDDAFMPTAVGARFTVSEYDWRSQGKVADLFQHKTPLSLFAALLYLLELCTLSANIDSVSHAMWSMVVSNQAAVRLPNKDTVFMRSLSTEVGSRYKFKQLVVSSEMCRESLAPFFLQDFMV